MTPDLRLLSGFARGVSLSLHVRVTCLHSGSWLLSGYFYLWLKSKTEGQMTKPFACAAADAIQLLFLPLRARERRNGMQGYPSLEIMRVLVSGSIPPFLTS